MPSAAAALMTGKAALPVIKAAAAEKDQYLNYLGRSLIPMLEGTFKADMKLPNRYGDQHLGAPELCDGPCFPASAARK